MFYTGVCRVCREPQSSSNGSLDLTKCENCKYNKCAPGKPGGRCPACRRAK